MPCPSMIHGYFGAKKVRGELTLVIAGEEDIMATPSQSRALADGIPGAELTMLPEWGHFCVVTEGAKDFADTMANFFKRVDAG